MLIAIGVVGVIALAALVVSLLAWQGSGIARYAAERAEREVVGRRQTDVDEAAKRLLEAQETPTVTSILQRGRKTVL